jgi:hypothetical protein
MASGHVNRTSRPNTWQHRPSLRREDSSCQPGAVHTWHKTDVIVWPMNVRFRGEERTSNIYGLMSVNEPGADMRLLSATFDPGELFRRVQEACSISWRFSVCNRQL